MNDWNSNWFMVGQAREHQQRLLREAGLDQRLRQARNQNEPRSTRVSLSQWVAHALGFHNDERALER